MLIVPSSYRERRGRRLTGLHDDARHPHLSEMHPTWSDGSSLASMPLANMLGGWSARSVGTAGAGGTLSLNDLSGNGKAIVSNVQATPLVLTASDSVCGGSPTVHSTSSSAGGSATIATYSAPITLYLVGYCNVTGGDIVTLGGGNILRLLTLLSGTAETWDYRAPTGVLTAGDATGVSTQASVVCATIPAASGTLNSYIGRSTPATASGTAGTIVANQTGVAICAAGTNVGGVLAELYLYSGTDSQATRFANMNILASRCNLPALTS